jgi:hypothetical protein
MRYGKGKEAAEMLEKPFEQGSFSSNTYLVQR